MVVIGGTLLTGDYGFVLGSALGALLLVFIILQRPSERLPRHPRGYSEFGSLRRESTSRVSGW